MFLLYLYIAIKIEDFVEFKTFGPNYLQNIANKPKHKLIKENTCLNKLTFSQLLDNSVYQNITSSI